MSLTFCGLVLVVFGVLYIARPAVYRKGLWMRTSVAIRLLSEAAYKRYIKALGVTFIVVGLACIGWDLGLASWLFFR